MYQPEILFWAWNLAVLLVYGADKLFATRGGRRIRESTLLSLAYLLGGVGAIFGMVLFHHKTGKQKFRLLVPLAVIFNLLLLRYGINFI
ncbi:MAG: DUF1294 domain-containing protein [Clostridia bacterium]|nr:DUF1294 domain-containing protein [Clostridia bacterium]